MADPTQMQQVLMNLCTNAAHAMEGESGTLTVGLDKDDEPALINLVSIAAHHRPQFAGFTNKEARPWSSKPSQKKTKQAPSSVTMR
jgi:signal transduction histidine kinase